MTFTFQIIGMGIFTFSFFCLESKNFIDLPLKDRLIVILNILSSVFIIVHVFSPK